MSSKRRVYGFGVIGCGLGGGKHAQAIARLENARLIAATGGSAERTRAFCDEHNCDVVADVGALVERPDIDVVSVCVPTARHAKVGVLVARAGKHALIEKPIEISLEAADQLIGATKSAGVAMTVVSQHRFDPAFLELQSLLSEGRLGRLLLGDARVKWYRDESYYEGSAWRGTWALSGGGALINQGIHYVDLLRTCLGPVREVRALCATQCHDIEVEDVALAMVRFDSGAVGSVEVTTAAYPGFHERLEITGTSGTVALEGGEMVCRDLREERDGAAVHPLSCSNRREKPGSGASDPGAIAEDGHARQMSDFLDAIEVGHEPLVSGADARATLELVLAIYESARANAPVCLPLPADRGQEKMAMGYRPKSGENGAE